jgi:hypothetical protein
VCLDARIVLEGVVDDAALISVQRLHFDDITPAPNFLRRFLCFFDEPITLLGAVVADVESYLWTFPDLL